MNSNIFVYILQCIRCEIKVSVMSVAKFRYSHPKKPLPFPKKSIEEIPQQHSGVSQSSVTSSVDSLVTETASRGQHHTERLLGKPVYLLLQGGPSQCSSLDRSKTARIETGQLSPHSLSEPSAQKLGMAYFGQNCFQKKAYLNTIVKRMPLRLPPWPKRERDCCVPDCE